MARDDDDSDNTGLWGLVGLLGLLGLAGLAGRKRVETVAVTPPVAPAAPRTAQGATGLRTTTTLIQLLLADTMFAGGRARVRRRGAYGDRTVRNGPQRPRCMNRGCAHPMTRRMPDRVPSLARGGSAHRPAQRRLRRQWRGRCHAARRERRSLGGGPRPNAPERCSVGVRRAKRQAAHLLDPDRRGGTGQDRRHPAPTMQTSCTGSSFAVSVSEGRRPEDGPTRGRTPGGRRRLRDW